VAHRRRPGRLIAVFLLALAALILPMTGGAPESAAQEKVKIDLWLFEGEEQLLPILEAAFEESHPNIDLEITLIPEDQYVVKLDTALAAGSPPDLGYMYEPRWVKAGRIMPLDETIAANEINLDDFNQAVMQGRCVFDGQVYCLGSYTGAVVLLYNKAMFDAAGLEYPSATEPMTIDEYAALAAQLTVPNEDPMQQIWGGTSGAPHWWLNPSTMFSEDARQVAGYVNDDVTKHTIEVLANMVAQRHAPSSAFVESLGTEASGDLFLQGKLAMTIGDFDELSALEDAGINYGVAMLPVEQAGDTPYLPVWTDSLAIFNGSDQVEAAQEFVAFLATEGQRLRVEETGEPPLSATAAEEFSWASQGNTAAREEFLQAIGAAQPGLFVPGFWDVTSPLEDAFDQIAAGEISAAEALDGAAPRMQDSLDDAWRTWEQIGG
jgi:multiple sugar transport system substrate-binding protein